jgi:phage tail sheath gpL-like
MTSDAIGVERISRILGYKLKKGTLSTTSPNLPQRIAIFAEANNANQATLSTVAKEITSAKQAGDLYGYGSPIYNIMRILRPQSGDGVGGIPTVVYPQAEASGAIAKTMQVSALGTANGNGTHYIKIGGRDNVDGIAYAINVSSGDTGADLAFKIEDAINNVLGSPFSAASVGYDVVLTSKWKGLTADELTVSVDTGEDDLNLSYTVSLTQAGSGTPSIADALSQIGNDWVTLVLDSYGTSVTMAALESFNGIPDPDSPTGRYAGLIMKPFIAVVGSTADDPSSITDAKLNDVTIAIAPAPLSPGQPMEAAANMIYLAAIQMQNNPHLDVFGKNYPDMPVPASGGIGSMATYNNRDLIVKKGCSTVDFVGGKYQVQDFVTSYHPSGEIPPQFRYCRNLNIDWNIRYAYYLLELINVIDHTIANDSDTVTAGNVVKPKQWKGILNSLSDDLVRRALTVDTDFMKDSLLVNIGETNPDRFETFFRYKRSGVVRVASTTAEANFNFGSV